MKNIFIITFLVFTSLVAFANDEGMEEPLLKEKVQETETIYANQSDEEIKGVSICLNRVINKVLLDENWKTQQKIQIDGGPKIDFTGMPKIVAKDLDPKKRVRIKITNGPELVTAWWQRFEVGVAMIKIQFKPGTWQAKPYGPGAKCDGEMP